MPSSFGRWQTFARGVGILKRRSLLLRVSALLLVGFCTYGQAALSVIGTRFVYPQQAPMLTVRLGNSGEQPILAQTWLDKGDPRVDPSLLTVPFVVSAPLVRLDPQRTVALQLRYTGEALPGDRESLFWINFLEIPRLPADSGHLLRLSYRLRMKVLFRPLGLTGSAATAARHVVWRLSTGGVLNVENPSPFYVCITALRQGQTDLSPVVRSITVEPFGKTPIALPAGHTGSLIDYDFVDDSGETVSARASLQS